MSTTAMHRARSLPSTRWALGRTSSALLGEAWGVSPSRARHMRADGTNCANDTNALIRDPKINGAAIVIANMEALVDRYRRQAALNPESLREEYARLKDYHEHFAEARQNRAIQTGEDFEAACLEHAELLVTLVAMKRALDAENAMRGD